MSRGWVGRTAGLEALKMKIISCNCWEYKHNYSAVAQPVAQSLYWLSYPIYILDDQVIIEAGSPTILSFLHDLPQLL